MAYESLKALCLIAIKTVIIRAANPGKRSNNATLVPYTRFQTHNHSRANPRVGQMLLATGDGRTLRMFLPTERKCLESIALHVLRSFYVP